MTIDTTRPLELSDGRSVTLIRRNKTDIYVRVPSGSRPPRGDWYFSTKDGHYVGDRSYASLRNVVSTPKKKATTKMTTKAKTTGPLPGQPETLLAAVTDSTKVGVYGPFTVKNGQVLNGRTPVFAWFDNSIGLVAISARTSIKTSEGQQLFDELLAAVRGTGATVRYIPSITGFMNPEARFAEFIAGQPPVGVTLTTDELRVPELLASVKARFTAAFTPPAPPAPPAPVYVRSTKAVTSSTRLTVSGKTVSNGTYNLTLAEAQKAWRIIQPLWLKTKATASSRTLYERGGMISGAGASRRLVVYPNRIHIGCQLIRREAIEELAVAQGWLKLA